MTKTKELRSITVKHKPETELFHQDGKPLNFDILSFWQWSASDLLSNAIHSILVEYLVARAAGHSELIIVFNDKTDSFSL